MRIIETPNFYRLTVYPSDEFTDFKTVRINDGMLVTGRREGRLEIQSMLFSKETHNMSSVRIRAFYYKNMFINA